MKTATGSPEPKGKGANFDTRPNPFGAKVASIAPAFGDHAELGLAVDNVIRSGCAIILGGTRDGGAVCITVLDGDNRHRTYCSNDTELDRAISALREIYSER